MDLTPSVRVLSSRSTTNENVHRSHVIVLKGHKRSVPHIGSVQIQIQIEKGWCTAETGSKV